MKSKSKKKNKKVSPKPTSSTKAVKTQIAIVLDSSGSMSSCQRETVDALNSQIKTIKENSKKMDTRVSWITFSDVVHDPKFFNKETSVLQDVDYKDYVPNGMTAMYDAVGKTVDKLLALNEDKDTAFLLVIISDGHENNSKEFTRETIAKKIKDLQGTNHWTFTYLGANQDLSDVSKHLNIPMGNTMSFTSTSDGVTASMFVRNSSTASYLSARAAGQTAVGDFYSGGARTTIDKKARAKAAIAK